MVNHACRVRPLLPLHVVFLRDIKILMRYIFRYLKISELWFGWKCCNYMWWRRF